MNFSDQFVQVGAIKTRYWQVGNQGMPLLLIHGIGVAVEWFSENIEALARTHRVYAVDLPGHGQTGKLHGDYSFANYASFIDQFMGAVGLERASVLGYSLGGGIATWLAGDFPQRVSSLVLVSCAGLGQGLTINFRLLTIPWLGEQLIKPSEKGSRQMLHLLFHDVAKAPAHFVDVLLRYGKQPQTQQAMLSTLRGGANLWGMRKETVAATHNRLGKVQAPTLVLWGKQDKVIPARNAEVVSQTLPGARLYLFDACGHSPHVEWKDEFHHQVLQFLQAG